MSAKSRKLCSTILAVGAPLGLVALAIVPGQALGQEIPVAVEGPLTGPFNNQTITVMDGVTFDVDSGNQLGVGTIINTPTAEITIRQVRQGPKLPGRNQNGLRGSTAIVEGRYDPPPGTGALVADSVFVEPAENVIVGAVTLNDLLTNPLTGEVLSGSLEVNGLPILLLEDGTDCDPLLDGTADDRCDERLPGEGARLAGFAVDPASIPLDTVVGAEGYYSTTQDAHYAFLLETDAGDLINAGSPEVSILRSECRNRDDNGRDEFSVDGATHDPDTGNVTVTGGETANGPFDVPLGSAAVAPDVAPIGTYQLENRALTFGADGCPDFVRVDFDGEGVFAIAPVDRVREDAAGG